MKPKHIFMGIVFGVCVGAIMRLPGPEYLTAAFAINLAVMAALWLGAVVAPPTAKGALVPETVAALATFVIVALMFQSSPAWGYLGFIFQAGWSFVHRSDAFGVTVQRWYPAFAMGVNLTLLVMFFLLRTYT